MFVGAGSVRVGTIDDWVPGSGSVVSWHPTPTSLEKARQAPISTAPASYMQAQHLRGFCDSPPAGWTTRGWSWALGTDRAGAIFVLLLTSSMRIFADTTPTAVGLNTRVWTALFGAPSSIRQTSSSSPPGMAR